MQKGFTLIELLISLALLVIIGAVGLLIVQGVRVRQELDLESDKLLNILREAQQNTISELNLSVWAVHVNNAASGPDSYELFYASSTDPEAASTTERTVTLPSTLEFTSPSSGSSTNIYFNSVSGVPVSAATVTIQTLNGANSVDIKVLENGSITK
ncbi:MAG: type II secretion system protein [Parcubacteria group bacterium]|nr:type II secretion system protein [Parcubacteria group bacterium]